MTTGEGADYHNSLPEELMTLSCGVYIALGSKKEHPRIAYRPRLTGYNSVY
jgi:hypothetical protein